MTTNPPFKHRPNSPSPDNSMYTPGLGTVKVMTRWGKRRPPSMDEELAHWTLHEPPELRALRASLAKTVRDPDLAERLTIVATELAGNALRHGRPPTEVLLLRSDGHLIVDVLDHDTTSHPVIDEGRPPGDGGLGLVLTERLAVEVGWYPTASGKSVWASFDAGPSATD
jgi:serine/threonine-protein kinase RsbW